MVRALKWKWSNIMSRVCDICGKGAVRGSTILRRGQAKKKGGIGQHVTAITPRMFKPNLQSVRALIKGQSQRVRVCTSCLRSGSIQKAP
jgi:large subunit ribosomal protein L28